MRKKLVFLWSAAADLAIDGVLGTVWFTLVFTLLVTGMSTIPALGVGVGLLWLTAWLATGIRFVERRRAEAIYGITITPPPRRLTPNTGFLGWLAQVFLDTFSAATWKGVLHHFITMVLGSVFFGIISGAAGLLVDVNRGALLPGLAGPVVTAIAAVLALAVLVLYTAVAGLADRALSKALLGTSRTIALEERVDVLQDARRGAVDAAAAERQRIERDLHDGVQPRLVSVAMTLDMARAKLADDDRAGASALLDDAHRETKQSITDLRHLARGIHPAVLTDRGLDAALSAVAQHCTVPTTVRADLPVRPSAETEAVLYFVVSEALTNASKHSRASGCSVSVIQTPAGVRAVILDNGVGGAAAGRGGGVGLTGMTDRVRAAGGTLTISSPEGGPTIITVEVPCAF
ncbi:sensor histidine kinase [Herbiconiux solani]|uniref:sensor histidine kinase n=1 Tax=Herbiconiux solani TaxID=661329 RepID=UPI0008251FE7|nr:histidine kinase [Herbiconiux solani]